MFHLPYSTSTNTNSRTNTGFEWGSLHARTSPGKSSHFPRALSDAAHNLSRITCVGHWARITPVKEKYMRLDQMLSIFLWTVGRNAHIRDAQSRFQHSKSTIHLLAGAFRWHNCSAIDKSEDLSVLMVRKECVDGEWG